RPGHEREPAGRRAPPDCRTPRPLLASRQTARRPTIAAPGAVPARETRHAGQARSPCRLRERHRRGQAQHPRHLRLYQRDRRAGRPPADAIHHAPRSAPGREGPGAHDRGPPARPGRPDGVRVERGDRPARRRARSDHRQQPDHHHQQPGAEADGRVQLRRLHRQRPEDGGAAHRHPDSQATRGDASDRPLTRSTEPDAGAPPPEAVRRHPTGECSLMRLTPFTHPTPAPRPHRRGRRARTPLAALALAAALAAATCSRGEPATGYEVIARFPHDTSAYTQGLLYHGGVLYESTGRYGASELRRVELETGRVLQRVRLPDDRFGEGLALLDGKLYQLTWESEVGYIYDVETLALLDSFTYAGEGWGLTTDGRSLIMSNGSDTLRYLDPQTFEITR